MKELQIIQSKLKAPKGNTNAFGKYKYRSCEDILEALKPLLAEQKCELIIDDEIVLIGERYYVKATACISIDSDGGNGVSVSAYAREPAEKKGMDLAQLTGATSSYARKYALNGLFAIDDTKDADTMKPPGTTVKMPKRADVNKALGECKTMDEWIKLYTGFTKKYGQGSMTETSGKQGDRNETWAMVFATHKNRLDGIPPVDAATGPDKLQKEFDSMAAACGDNETYQLLVGSIENNPALQTDENYKILNTLELAHGE